MPERLRNMLHVVAAIIKDEVHPSHLLDDGIEKGSVHL
jgi:hypothetical protein